MATINLGRIKPVFKGTYAGGTAYVVDDIVTFTDGGITSAYICKVNSTGNNPSSGGTAHASWAYLAKGSGDATLTTRGDVLYYGASGNARLGAGTSGFFLKTQGAGADPIWSQITEYDDSQVQNNIAILGFKMQTTNSLAKFTLDDQIVDEFVDATGIDAGNSTNEVLDGGVYKGQSGSGNYWGDSSDGSLTVEANTNLSVPNTNGSYDGDMVIKNYENLTINSGYTLTTAQPCRGMIIFVKGNCVINGTLSMRERGALADPTSAGGSDSAAVDSSGLRIGYIDTGATETLSSVSLAGCGTAAVTVASKFPALSSNGHIFNIDRQGAAGAGNVSGHTTQGNDATSAANKTGGGGSGGSHERGNTGAGAYGACFGGGSGGGGSRTGSATAAVNWGGKGGNAGSGTGCAGGAGNPNGNGNSGFTASGETGTGGTLFLFVKGNLTIGGSGVITAEGSKGDTATEGGGGNSGSGAIIIGYAGTLSNSGSITVGARARNTSTNNGKGGQGAAGYTETVQVDVAEPPAADLTLQSNASTALASPSTGDLVMLYSNNEGTATLNTDIKAYISRDNGSTWIQGTLVAEGDYGSQKIASFHNKAFTGSAGTNMKYKITTHNQSAGSKSTHVNAVSLGWA